MTWDLITPASNYTPLSRERWRPRISAGFLNVGDKQYYLYGDKRTTTLANAKCTRFTLSRWPLPTEDVTVTVSGVDYKYWVLRGNELLVAQFDVDTFIPYWGGANYNESEWTRLRLAGIDFSPTSTAVVSYSAWTGPGYSVDTIEDSFTFADGDTEYWLNDVPTLAAPIVITDDTRNMYQGNTKVQQFRIDTSEVLVNRDSETALENITLRTKIEFSNPTNFVTNSCFSEFSTTLGISRPKFWRLTGPGVIHSQTSFPYHGKFVCKTDGHDFIQQEVDIKGEPQVVVTAFAKAASVTTTARLGCNFLQPTGVSFLDLNMNTVAATTDNTYQHVVTGEVVTPDAWSRVNLYLGATDLAHPVVNSALPTYDHILLIKASGTGVIWGAMQVTPGLDSQDFSYIDPAKVTIEYETSDEGIFIPDPKKEFPYDISNVDANPLNDPTNAGFLALKSVPWADDFNLGFGRATAGEPINEFAQYTGVGGANVLSKLEDSFEIEGTTVELPYHTNYGFAPTATTLLAHIPTEPTGLVTTANRTAYYDVVMPRVTTALGNPLGFAGVLLDIGTHAVSGVSNLPSQWVTLATGIAAAVITGFPGQAVFGVHNGYEMFHPSVSNRNDIAAVIDMFVADGVTKNADEDTLTEADRQHNIALIDMVRDACLLGNNTTVKFVALDYVSDEYDFDAAADGRKFAHDNNLIHGIADVNATNGPPLISKQVPTKFGIPSAIFHSLPGSELGRNNLPYARIDGPGKFVPRATFTDSQPYADETATHSVDENPPVKIDFLPGTDAYRSGGVAVAVVRVATTVDPEFVYRTKMSLVVYDQHGNPCDGIPVNMSVAYGTLRTDAGDGGSSLRLYTNHGGYVYFTYESPTYQVTDTVVAEVRRFGLTSSLSVRVIT